MASNTPAEAASESGSVKPVDGVEGSLTFGVTPYAVRVIMLSFVAWTLVSLDAAFPGLALPKISDSLGLSLSTLEYLLGAFNAVTFLAPVLLGRYVDRMGRKRVFQLSLLGTSIFGGLTAFVGSAWQFIVVRLFAGTSYGIVEPSVNTVVVEETPPRWRGLIMGFVQAGYPIGAAVAGDIATALLPGQHGWRTLFLIAFAPALVVLFATRYMRESKRYTDMRSTARIEGIETRPGWRPLFSRELRRQTLVTALFGICINGGVGLVLGVATSFLVAIDHLELSQATLLFSLSNWAALCGQLFVGWIADHLPSKWVIVGFSVVAAAFLAILAFPGISYAWAATALIGFGFFGNGTFGAYPRYTTESFPTEYRGTGTSFSLGSSFLSLAIIPLVAGPLIDSSTPRVIPIISAAFVLLGALVMAFGRNIRPRTHLTDFVPRAHEAGAS